MVLALAFGAASPAFAQGGDHPERGDGPLSEYLIAAYADATGLSVEEVQSRVVAGETLKDIAASLGYSDLKGTVGSNALAMAVSAGAITQEQVDRLANREEMGGKGAGIFEKLGLSKEETKALLDSGMTMQEIFAQQGVARGPRDGSHGGNFDPRDGSRIAEFCGVSTDEVRSRMKAGETMQEICPGFGLP